MQHLTMSLSMGMLMPFFTNIRPARKKLANDKQLSSLLKTLSMTMKTSFMTLTPGGAEAEVEDARLALKIHWL